jgi:predicted DNA-binding transcriptional regulator AlpA
MAEASDLLDERTAARRLGISRRSMWGLADSGAIPFIKIGPRLKRYDPRDLADFIERNRRHQLAGSNPARPSGSGALHLLYSLTDMEIAV